MEQTAAEVERGAAARPARAPAQRERLTLLAWASFLPLLALWHSLTQRLENQPRIPRRQAIRLPLAEGLTVDGQVAIWREGDTLSAVSLRCSHLGCWLRPSGDGGLVCPCHGSRFDGRGRLLRGPARQPLQALAVRVEKARETLVVELPS